MEEKKVKEMINWNATYNTGDRILHVYNGKEILSVQNVDSPDDFWFNIDLSEDECFDLNLCYNEDDNELKLILFDLQEEFYTEGSRIPLTTEEK